jgi:hypothetical protein
MSKAPSIGSVQGCRRDPSSLQLLVEQFVPQLSRPEHGPLIVVQLFSRLQFPAMSEQLFSRLHPPAMSPHWPRELQFPVISPLHATAEQTSVFPQVISMVQSCPVHVTSPPDATGQVVGTSVPCGGQFPPPPV